MGDIKSLGGKLSEFRVDVGQGYRLYAMRTGNIVILLLIGGDKSSQAADIKRSREMIKVIEAAAKAVVKDGKAGKPKKRK
jgi:putative addiction module killer protein